MNGFGKLFIAGLGALALSCTGVHVRELSEFKGLTDAADTLSSSKDDEAQCVKLNALPSEEEEYTLGGAIALNWVSRGNGLVPLNQNEKLVRYINVVGKNLGAQSSRPLLTWTFGVLQTDQTFNALSAPGGYVFVTRGLLRGVENEAQLAGVLAHEIAHVTGRDVLKHYTETKVAECKRAAGVNRFRKAGQQAGLNVNLNGAEALLSIAKSGGPFDPKLYPQVFAGLADSVVDTLVNGGLSENEEFAADAEAVRLMVSAGYDPQEYLDFLAKLPDNSTVFSHHPRKVDRRKRLVTFIRENQNSQGGFSEFAPGTEGLVQPPLPPEFASVKKTAAQDRP
ncbi:MAG: M48 family metalloprotease [Hyalangium sp.]|uniref:M48 family metalloprotease n=1 Tax=Hyalangium sp. TaxID=2028555 RepID=UPI00389A0C79